MYSFLSCNFWICFVLYILNLYAFNACSIFLLFTGIISISFFCFSINSKGFFNF